MAEDHCAYTRLVDLHAFDAVGRDDALRDSMFPQYFEALGRLTEGLGVVAKNSTIAHVGFKAL
jgi:hypothetical protein